MPFFKKQRWHFASGEFLIGPFALYNCTRARYAHREVANRAGSHPPSNFDLTGFELIEHVLCKYTGSSARALSPDALRVAERQGGSAILVI